MAKYPNRKKTLRSAREWALHYSGTHIVEDFQKKFPVNMENALKILDRIGAMDPERLEAMRKSAGIVIEVKDTSDETLPTKPEPTPESIAAKEAAAEKRRKMLEKRRRRQERKKKQPVVPKRKERMKQARKMLSVFSGENPIQIYREKFRVDVFTAVRELGELGILTEEQIDAATDAEQRRIRRVHRERYERETTIYERFPDSDDRFFYIAGYTSGGAPYGVTWEEMGLEPWTLPEDFF